MGAGSKPLRPWQVCAGDVIGSGKRVMFGETLYGGDGRDWLIVGIAGAWSYDVYGLHVAHDGKKEKKPLRAEWLVHELTDAGEEV